MSVNQVPDESQEPRGRPMPAPRLGGVLPPDDDGGDNDGDDAVEARTLLEGRPPVRTPLGPQPSMEVPPAISPQRRKEMETNYDDFRSKFDFKASTYKCTLVRTKPQLFKGREIGGWLGQYEEPLPTEEVKNTFGGGAYTWQIHGPNPKLNGRQTLLDAFSFKIAGDPIVENQPGQESTDQTPLLVKSLMDSKDRDMQRVVKEAEETRKMLLQQSGRADNGMKEIVAMVANIANPQGLKETLAEERRATEARLKDEREERRLEAAAAERRHQEMLAAADRQHQATLKTMELRHEKDMAEIRARAEADRKAAQDAAQAKNTSSDTMLLMTQKMQQDQIAMIQAMNASQEKRTQEATAFMANMQLQQQTAMMTTFQQMEAMKSDFLTKQLERMENKKDDTLEAVQKMVALRDMFDDMSGRTDKRDTWEKVAETVKDAAPGLLAAFAGARAPATVTPQIKPGSVAIVDMPPAKPRLVAAKKPKKPATFTEGLKPPVAPPAPAPEPEWKPEPPPDTAETEALIKHMVASTEEALQRDWEVKQVFDQIVSKYPKIALDLLKAAGPEQCSAIIGQLAPAEWAINTLRGKKLIEDLLMILSTWNPA